jgi:hypothetical protein
MSTWPLWVTAVPYTIQGVIYLSHGAWKLGGACILWGVGNAMFAWAMT